jgi:hypothetical protein
MGGQSGFGGRPDGGPAGYGGQSMGGQSGFGGQADGGQAGFGGSPGTPPPVCVYPSIGFSPTPFEAASSDATLEDVLSGAMTGMVGSWHGVVTTPWVSPYEVTVSFRADGTYSGQCVWQSNVCCEAFYYGTDDDSSLKRYALDTINTSKAVSGTIDIIYGGRGVAYYESGYQGYLRNLRLNAGASRMQFEFWYGTDYGPLVFDLERVP